MTRPALEGIGIEISRLAKPVMGLDFVAPERPFNGLE